MKKRIAIAMILSMILPTCVAFAGDANDPMAVTLISGPEEEEAEQVSLDDVQTDKEIEIEGFGNITFTSFNYVNSNRLYNPDDTWAKSGEEADFACLYYDILNTNVKDKDYLANVEVKAIYADDYEYGGWCFQIDYDWHRDYWVGHENENHAFSISPMYSGHYVAGVTLPNAVINGKGELKMIITIDGNEMTYYIRKSS